MQTGYRMCLAMGGALALVMGLSLTAATDAEAKSQKKKNCAAAEALFQATGQGDLDGDGLSDCRETRQLRTSSTNPDTDDDDLMDGDEVSGHSDPRDSDSDDDGLLDGDDDSPRIREQKIEGFLDGLTCPSVGVLGSISVLGTTAVLDDVTEFEDGTCAELAEALAAAGEVDGTPVFVEIEIAEDAAGALKAIEVEIKHGCDDHDSDDDENDDDDDSQGEN